MMDVPDPASSIGFRGPEDRALRSRFFQALAQALAGTSGPAAIVFETSTDRRSPHVTVRPSALLRGILAAPTFHALREEAMCPNVSAVFDLGPLTESWTLEPARGSPPTTPAPGTWDIPERSALLGPTGRVDAQTFWLSGRSDGRLWVGRRVRFGATTTEEVALHASLVANFAAVEWSQATGVLCRASPARPRPRDWATAAPHSFPKGGWLQVPSFRAHLTAEPALLEEPGPRVVDGHAIALGTTGAGKTTFLASQAAQAIRQGFSVLAVDLHGDLAPAIVDRLDREERERIVTVDAGRRPVVGVAALANGNDRTAAHLVAAVKRLSPDGNDVYWGFRLERIFDAFVRLVQEAGGTVGDLYALLTDVNRREAARLSTRVPELARFLEELGPIVRRTPEFLWSAAARLAKVVLVPELAELLAPPDGGVPVEDLLETRRSLLVRIPFSVVGPEAAAFAGSLILARAYLGVVARRDPTGAHGPLFVVLDEVQGFSPRLVAEMLTEGRKFGLRLVVASQYPERLSPELRLAAAGVACQVIAFRVPSAAAPEVGNWVGLAPTDALRVLPELPVGVGVVRGPDSGGFRTLTAGEARRSSSDRGWREARERTLAEFPVAPETRVADLDEATERLLLAVLASEERGAPVPTGNLADLALELPGPVIDRAVMEDRTLTLERSGLAHRAAGTWHLTPAGERRLGLLTTTGASIESAEHRALLLRAFRLLARHGLRLQILRQGRYDTTLPDAILHQMPDRCRDRSPRELAETLRSVERTWGWRFFGGRDVHVEAEVSGALRPERVRHGLQKARNRQAFVLFLVGDAAKAARIRRTLKLEGLRPDRAQVWTLRAAHLSGEAAVAQYRDGKPGAVFPPA